MAKRFTDTGLYSKAWFRRLPPKIKCLWEWLRSNCDHAGVVDFDSDLASFQIGDEVCDEDLNVFGRRIEKISDDKYWIVDFVSYQYGDLKENYNPHKPVISSLKKHGLFSRVAQGLPKTLPSLVDKDKDKGKDKDKDKDKGKDKAIVEILEFWNSQQIIQHTANEGMILDISKKYHARLKLYSHEDIRNAIKNYSDVLHDSNSFFSYRWKLGQFLARSGAIEFYPDNFIRENYISKKVSNGQVRSNAQQRQENILNMVNPYE